MDDPFVGPARAGSVSHTVQALAQMLSCTQARRNKMFHLDTAW